MTRISLWNFLRSKQFFYHEILSYGFWGVSAYLTLFSFYEMDILNHLFNWELEYITWGALQTALSKTFLKLLLAMLFPAVFGSHLKRNS